MTEPDDELVERLRTAAEAFQPGDPPLHDILREGVRRRWRRRAEIGIVALVLLAGVAAPLGLLSRLGTNPRHAHPAVFSQSKLVFSQQVDRQYLLYTANADGSNLQEIPTALPNIADPAWSPDGSQIVFSGAETGDTEPYDLYTINANGSGLERLTHDPAIWDWDPAWSPDGTTIVFIRNVDGHGRIFLLTVASGEMSELPLDGYQASDPAWSPDGSKIAFTGNVDGLQSIFVMNADGSELHRLTKSHNRWGDGDPAWSPDGSQIAFDRVDEGDPAGPGSPNVDIYVMPADGSNLSQLTSDPGLEGGPVWSPDGSQIAFIAGDMRASEIYTMAPDGSNVRQLTTGVATGYSPDSFAAPGWKPTRTEH